MKTLKYESILFRWFGANKRTKRQRWMFVFRKMDEYTIFSLS